MCCCAFVPEHAKFNAIVVVALTVNVLLKPCGFGESVLVWIAVGKSTASLLNWRCDIEEKCICETLLLDFPTC